MASDEEDTICFTMEEFSKFQQDLLNYKHENQKLQVFADKFALMQEISDNPVEDLGYYKGKVETGLPSDVAYNCLKAIRKQEQFTEEEMLLIEQMLSITKHVLQNEVSTDGSDFPQEMLENAEVSALQKENKRIKLELESVKQRSEVISEALDNVTKDNSELQTRLQQFEYQNENLISDLANREEEVSEARQQLKEKYKLECSVRELELEKQDLLAKIAELQQTIEEVKKDIDSEQRAQLQQQNQELQEQLESAHSSENFLKLEYQNLKTSAKQTIDELRSLKTAHNELEKQYQQQSAMIKKLSQEVEDARTEKQIIQKRSMHDMKDIKAELVKEKSLHEQCKMEREKMYQEVRRLNDLQRNMVHSKGESVSVQERTIVEFMSIRINELELELAQCQDQIKSVEEYQKEVDDAYAEVDRLFAENQRLQEDLGSMGARINEMIRQGVLSKKS